MPTVSITMTEEAYDIYRNWAKGRRSKMISVVILEWNARKEQYEEEQLAQYKAAKR